MTPRFFSFFLFLLLIVSGATAADDARPLRVTVMLQVGGAAEDLAVQETVAADLGKDVRFEVIERSAIELLLREGGLNALAADAGQRARLGRLLSLDRFVQVRRAGGVWLVEIVDAQSGELLAHGEERPPQTLAALTSDLLLQPAKAAKEAPLRVAVPDFDGAPAGDRAAEARLLQIGAAVRGTLRAGGIEVLDRLLTGEVAREHSIAEQGLTDGSRPVRPLLGARLVVRGTQVNEAGKDLLEFSLLDTARGRVVATRRFPLPTAQLPPELTTWLFGALHVEAPVLSAFAPSTEIEALEPFYAGIALFESGRFLEAAEKFEDVFTLHEKFGEAILWQARCYEAANLPELGAALRHYQRTALVGGGISRAANVTAQNAITFLGVTAPSVGDAQATAVRANLLAIDTLAARVEPRLLLDQELVRFRDEYDQLVGTLRTDGPRWETAPGFVSARALRGEMAGPAANGSWSITWSLLSPLDGAVLGRETAVLEGVPEQWAKAIDAALTRLLAAPAAGAEVKPPPFAPLPPVAEIEARLKRAKSPREANLCLLQLVIADPANALVPGRKLVKPGNSRTGLSAYLNFGLRDHLIAALPPENSMRAWLELIQIQQFMPHEPFGFLVSARRIDPRAAYATFSAVHPDDLPGALAEYFLLFDSCGKMAPVELATRLEALQKRLARVPGRRTSFPDILRIDGITECLLRLAKLAAGQPGAQKPDSEWPRFYVLGLDDTGRPKLTLDSYFLPAVDSDDFEFTPEQAIIEARAVLAIAGRPSEYAMVDEHWLKDCPHSLVLTAFCASALEWLNRGFGQPVRHPFDGAAEKAAHRALVAYVRESLVHWMRAATRREQMDQIEDWVRRVVMFTGSPAFAETVPDAEHLATRDELIREMAAGDARVGRTQWSILNPIFSRWRTFDREFFRRRDGFRTEHSSIAYYDKSMVIAEVKGLGVRAFTNQPVDLTNWWSAIRGDRLNDSAGPDEVAALAVEQAENLHRLYPGPDLSERDMGQLLDFGIVLMDGGQFTEAERAFHKVDDAAPSDLNRFGEADSLRASAAYYLAVLMRQAGRPAEATVFARRALELARSRAFPLILRYNMDRSYGGVFYYMENNTSIRAYALRLLSELRFDPLTARLPERMGVIEVPTPNLDNPRLRIYYRVPPGADTAKEPLPVLVLASPYNHSALDYCREAGDWMRFADEAGMVVVVPDFFSQKWATVMSPSIAGYGFAQVWSGAALIQGLDQLAERVPIRRDGLLFHGYGEGASWCERFARWRPDLCRAVSAHSTSSNPWWEKGNGLQSLIELRGVPFLLTCGEEDNRGDGLTNRYENGVQFTTMARGAGVHVLWRSWPDVPHVPTREMEDLSRAFLRTYARSGLAPAEFVGDRRNWRYYAAGSAAAEAIPVLFREEIASREIARQWGQEGR